MSGFADCNRSAMTFSASLPTVFASTMGLHPLTLEWSLLDLGIITICSCLHSAGICVYDSAVTAMSLIRDLPSGVSLMTLMRR